MRCHEDHTDRPPGTQIERGSTGGFVRKLATLVLVSVIFAPSVAEAQWPPERLKNVKVLPADIPIRSLLDTMRSFTRALGVRCSYCHVGGETTPFETLDFSSDSMPAKVKAREMLRMLKAINGEYLTRLVDRREPGISVTCATCHRGIAQPRPLQQVLIAAYDGGGVDSVEKAYRALRQRYFGSASYDFGEVPLADVAEAVRTKSGIADAVRIHRFNVTMSPQSGFALRQTAQAELSSGDTTAAIATLQRALSLNANDSQATAILNRLRRPP
jgi:hypothetical protein